MENAKTAENVRAYLKCIIKHVCLFVFYQNKRHIFFSFWILFQVFLISFLRNLVKNIFVC